MGQIRDFFRSDFSTFWLGEPKCIEKWSSKVQDLSNFMLIYHSLGPNLASQNPTVCLWEKEGRYHWLNYSNVVAFKNKQYKYLIIKVAQNSFNWHWRQSHNCFQVQSIKLISSANLFVYPSQANRKYPGLPGDLWVNLRDCVHYNNQFVCLVKFRYTVNER